MGSYRNSYPSGAASASAAYRYPGDTLRSHEASLLGLHSQGDNGLLSNPVGLMGRGSMYDYGLTLHTASDFNGGGLLPLPLYSTYGRSMPAQNGDIGGIAAYSGADLQGGLRGSELLSRSLLSDFKGSSRDMMASQGRTLYTGHSSFNIRSAETDVCSYGGISDAYVSSTYHKQQVEKTPHTSSQPPVRKRRTLSLDEIIRETWELHSLFRAGLAAASGITESSSIDDIISSEKWGKPSPTSIVGDSGWGSWVDTSFQKEPHFDQTWNPASNGLFGTSTSSWKELDVPNERKGGTPNKKQKGSSLQHGTEQEQHASDLQRFTCKRVAEFMRNYSDGDSSDDDSFVDSDYGAPNVHADLSCDVKSREERAFEFFLQTFVESKELQKLFSEQCHVGKFECLVCSSIPGKPAKKYNGLISVIMHASKILKTKKKQEHRGYARALCSAMGWELCRLPGTPGSSSPHPRCCIPTNEEEITDAKQNAKATKENESSDDSERDLDN